MFLYTTVEAIVAIIAGILIAVCTKKADACPMASWIGQGTNILPLLFTGTCSDPSIKMR